MGVQPASPAYDPDGGGLVSPIVGDYGTRARRGCYQKPWTTHLYINKDRPRKKKNKIDKWSVVNVCQGLSLGIFGRFGSCVFLTRRPRTP